MQFTLNLSTISPLDVLRIVGLQYFLSCLNDKVGDKFYN